MKIKLNDVKAVVGCAFLGTLIGDILLVHLLGKDVADWGGFFVGALLGLWVVLSER